MMLAPHPDFDGIAVDHKCERPRLISEAPHTLPKGERFSRRTPKARSTSNKTGRADHPVGSQEYPMWQTVRLVAAGLTLC